MSAPWAEASLPQPARLAVGIVSAGRVGTALGQALEAAGHIVGSVVARSTASLERASHRLPESRILPLPEVVAGAELLIIAVPDHGLPAVVNEIADSGRLRPGAMVLHTAGASGVAVLEPLTRLGAVPMAVHPAMTFVGTAEDTRRLARTCFGITAADEIGYTIAASLVLEVGGEPVRIAEADRTLYHAALAHGANHLIALITDAVTALTAAIDGADHNLATATVDGDPVRLAERILEPLVTASLRNVLDLGSAALTGPVARGDTAAVAAHLEALAALPDSGIAEAYRGLARRAAAGTDAPAELLELLTEAS